MAEYISQQCSPTATPSTLARVDYLLNNLGNKLENTIKAYFAENPEGETVTLAVFKLLSHTELLKLTTQYGKTLNQIKQDIGVAIPIIGSKIYSADKFHTYRHLKTRRNASRRTPVQYRKLVDVDSYTPHRLKDVPTIEALFGMVSSTADGVEYQNQVRSEQER